MLTTLIITALVGVAGVLLLEKWKVDEYMNLRGVKWWPRNPCLLCRAFWIGAVAFWLMLLEPRLLYVFLPLAAIPIQRILTNLILNRL